MLRYLLFFLFLVSIYTVSAQSQITVIGLVTNEQEAALEGASIIDINSPLGTTTNKDGIFQLSLPRRITSLNVSFVGYYSFLQDITPSTANGDTIYVSIQLQVKSTELEPVEINADKIQLVYKQPSIYIHDFKLLSTNILMLLTENKQRQVRIVDHNDRTLFNLNVSNQIDGIYEDCFGQFFLQTADSVFQLKTTERSIKLGAAYPNKEFEKYVTPCATVTEEFIFRRTYGPFNQSINYFIYNKSTKEQNYLFRIADENSERAIAEAVIELKREKSKAAPVMGGVASTKAIKEARRITESASFLSRVVCRPIYNPLIRLNDSIRIFNHLENKIITFNLSGQLQRTIAIDYHANKDWDEQLIYDKITQKMYAKFKRNNKVYLTQLDPVSGKLESEQSQIDKHIFLGGLTIRNGYAYYLFKDNEKLGAPQKIYRQLVD